MSAIYMIVEHNLTSGKTMFHGHHDLWNSALIKAVEIRKDAEYTSNDTVLFQIIMSTSDGEIEIVYPDGVRRDSLEPCSLQTSPERDF